MEKQKKQKSFAKFETSTISTSSTSGVKGGCTCGTKSICHIDGTIDFESIK